MQCFRQNFDVKSYVANVWKTIKSQLSRKVANVSGETWILFLVAHFRLHSIIQEQCSRKRVRQLKKNAKSHVFWILKKNR